MKGIIITTDNRIEVQEFERPLYESIGKIVDGYIEIVHPRGISDPYCMIANEEGLLKDLPINEIGCILYQTFIHGYPIVGNIVIMKIGDTPDGSDIVGLEDSEIDLLMPQFSMLLHL